MVRAVPAQVMTAVPAHIQYEYGVNKFCTKNCACFVAHGRSTARVRVVALKSNHAALSRCICRADELQQYNSGTYEAFGSCKISII